MTVRWIPDPLRAPDTDEEPWLPPAPEPVHPAVLGLVLAAVSGFVVGLVVMWAVR